MTLSVEQLTVDVIPVNVRLTDADAEECALLGLSERDAVLHSVFFSDEAWVLRSDRTPLVYGGYRAQGLLANVAYVWMLGTPEANAHSVAIARLGRRAMSAMLSKYTYVSVPVSCTHLSAHRWARSLGFTPIQTNDLSAFIEFRAEKGQLPWEH